MNQLENGKTGWTCCSLPNLKRIKRFYPKELFRTLKTEIFQAPGHQTIEQTELEIWITQPHNLS